MSVAELSLPKSNWKQNKAIRWARSRPVSIQQTVSLKKKETKKQLEKQRNTERLWEQFTVELMSNILQHHNLCHTPLLIAPTWTQEQFSNYDVEDDIIFPLKSLTVKTTQR